MYIFHGAITTHIHFLVHIQAGEIATSTTDRLSECVAKACNKKTDIRGRMWCSKEESMTVERIVGTRCRGMWWQIGRFSDRDWRL